MCHAGPPRAGAMRRVRLGYLAGSRAVLYSFSRSYLRRVLPRPVRRKRRVLRRRTGGEARASTQSGKRRQRAASAAPAASSNGVLGDSPVKSPSRKSWGYYVTTVRFQVYLKMPGREADRSLFRAPRCRVLQYRSRSRQSPGCGSEPVVEQFPPTLILAVPRIANLEPILAVHSVPTLAHDSFQILLKHTDC